MFCPANSGQRYVPGTAVFDGSNDYLTRDAGLTGASDNKLGTLSMWINKTGSDGATKRLISSFDTLGGSGSALQLRSTITTGNAFSLVAENAAGTIILNMRASDNSVETADG